MFYNVEIEILRNENGKLVVYIANDGSSGCKYNFETKEELKEIIKDYVDNLVEYEFDPDDVESEDDEY